MRRPSSRQGSVRSTGRRGSSLLVAKLRLPRSPCPIIACTKSNPSDAPCTRQRHSEVGLLDKKGAHAGEGEAHTGKYGMMLPPLPRRVLAFPNGLQPATLARHSCEENSRTGCARPSQGRRSPIPPMAIDDGGRSVPQMRAHPPASPALPLYPPPTVPRPRAGVPHRSLRKPPGWWTIRPSNGPGRG